MEIDKLKDIIQDSNLNFLVGSGLSVPYFSTLANIEVLLTDVEKNISLDEKEKTIIRASIIGKYFENVILKNPFIISDTVDAVKTDTLNNYKDFLICLNTIVLKRKSTILNKQVNIFTTNIDVFLEKALEETQLECNDGFYGRFNPIFSLSNFKKSSFKKSLHYDNTSEIPIFNLLKVHGSLTWKSENDCIYYSNLDNLKSIDDKFKIVKSKLIDFADTDKIDPYFSTEIKSKIHDKSYDDFLNEYLKLAIVNPTKEKFQDTTLNLQYYELLRLLSNELEKENTLLIIFGFSMADEHIREIILRAANSNPTLMIKIFAYDDAAKMQIDINLKKGSSAIKYNNIETIAPNDPDKYNFATFNKAILQAVLEKID